MPGAIVHADQLDQLAAALNQKVGRDFEVGNGLKVGVGIDIELTKEKVFNVG
jgi:hypothetical protein